jgi:hypothetical protein
MYPMSSSLLVQSPRVATLTPYFSNAQYSNYFLNPTNRVLEPRLWNDDFNHDGLLDILAISGIWSPDSTINWTKSIIQMFQNQGKFQFNDVTDKLNSQWDKNSDPDYEMRMVDIDKSGIKTLLVGSGTFATHPNANGNYILLNDGTGNLYTAFHSDFVTWGQQAIVYAQKTYQGYINNTAVPNFRGYLDANGYLNYVADISSSLKNANNIWVNQEIFVNFPVRINVSTDFTQNITVSDRNNSMLMRTWAGNDVFYDTNASSKPTKIDGGLGLNTSVYSGQRSQYSITRNSNGTTTLISLSSAPVQVNDTLKNIQIIQFADQSITLN